VTYARTHQHIATDSAQTRVRHHQDQEPDRPKASGPLGVQVSAINYFHTCRPAATGKDAVGSPGPDACRCRPFTASLLSHRGLAPGALKKSHINLFFVQRASFDKRPPALGGSIQPSLLGADKKHKRPDEARPFLGFPASAAPRGFCSRRGKSMGPRTQALVRNHSPRRGVYGTSARGTDDDASHFTSRRRRDPDRVVEGQRWVTVLVPIRPVRSRVVTSNVITPRPGRCGGQVASGRSREQHGD
jgi:hypothetical protein